MRNRDVFHTDPDAYRIANQGVAKISFPPSPEALETLRGELETFVCDGEYAKGLARTLEAFLASAGRGAAPAVWISGFYGSGKSHLANMLAALWTDLAFPDGARAQGLVQDLPPAVAGPLKELRTAATRMGGALAAGDTLGSGPDHPVEATLGIVLRAVGLPTDLRAAQVAFWLADEGILEPVRASLGATFDAQIRNFVLSTRFAEAVLAAKPSLASDALRLREDLKANFPQSPQVSIDMLTKMMRRALTLGRSEIPLTLLVLDEVQQFIRLDPALTLQIQTIAERISNEFEGRILLVCTGQQALTDVPNLQKLMGRFRVQVALGEADIDTVIRRTVLRKSHDAEPAIRHMLDACAGEISRHLQGSPLAHAQGDADDAVSDWPLLPTRRRVWERVLRELDRSGLGGTLRGQLSTALDAARAVADKPLGHAVPTDFLYSRFADEAYNAGLLPTETRTRIEKLRAGPGDDPLKARILMLVYVLGRIQGDVDHHGVRPRADVFADLLVENLYGEPELRRKVPELLERLRDEGAVIELGGEWRLQTKESAEWEQAYKAEERRVLADPTAISRVRTELLSQAVATVLASATSINHGRSSVPRRIHRLGTSDRLPTDGIAFRLHFGWDQDLDQVAKDIAAEATTEGTIHLLVFRHRTQELNSALAEHKAAESVLHLRGVPQTAEGKEARAAMEARAARAKELAERIVQEAVEQSKVVLAGGSIVSGTPGVAVQKAAESALARLYPNFQDADHPGWEKVLDRARRKDPDAIKAVDHNGSPETHPVCRAVLNYLGPGRKGSEIRAKFQASPYGWPQDAIDAALTVLANAGQVRVRGEDGKAASLPDLPRAKIGLCTFATETIVITPNQRFAVRGLLMEMDLPYEQGQEAMQLSALLERLETEARLAGGEPPAPAAPDLPERDRLRDLSGNELFAAIADQATNLRASVKAWREAKERIAERLPRWRLAERLVRLGAAGQETALYSVRANRSLLADPDPVPPIIQAAAEDLRKRLNAAWDQWHEVWEAAQRRLEQDESWQRLTPDQRRAIREQVGLLPVDEPKVATPEDVAEALESRSLRAWGDVTKALPTRVDDAIEEATALLEPKARRLDLPSRVLKNEPELVAWLEELRARIAGALPEGPVIPRV